MDNRYFNNKCPPLMNDGRFITNYMESRVVEQYVRKMNNLESAQDYKNFLQQNADAIMERERKFADNNNKCTHTDACPPLSEHSVNLGLNGDTKLGCVRRQ